jgi:hypothetical protein
MVKAAKFLVAISIRVNARRPRTMGQMQEAAIDGLGRLAEYAEGYGINVIVKTTEAIIIRKWLPR